MMTNVLIFVGGIGLAVFFGLITNSENSYRKLLVAVIAFVIGLTVLFWAAAWTWTEMTLFNRPLTFNPAGIAVSILVPLIVVGVVVLKSKSKERI